MRGKCSVLSLSANSSGSLLIAGLDNQDIKLYDLRDAGKSGDPAELSLRGHEDIVRQVCMSRQGLACLSGSADGTVRMWDLRLQQSVAVYDLHAASSVRQLIPFHHFSKLSVVGRMTSR